MGIRTLAPIFGYGLPDPDMYFHLHICVYVTTCENICACIFLHRCYADEINTLKTFRLVAVGTSYTIPHILGLLLANLC